MNVTVARQKGWAVLIAAALFAFASTADAQTVCAPAANPIVRFETSLGDIDVELCAGDANLEDTVDNFLQYVDDGAYTSTGFIHRSVNEGIDVIQGGGAFIGDGGIMEFVETRDPVPIAQNPTIDNARGTIAMARAGNDVNSATSQWFFNVQDNPGLDVGPGQNPDLRFIVFGEVVAGLDVVDDIAAQEIWALNGGFLAETPLIDFPNDGSSFLPFLVTISNVSVVPEPVAAVQSLAAVSVLALLAARRRRAA